MSIHSASSASWGDQATARICQLIVDSNKCIVQQILENRTDLLDLLTVQELSEPDDLGLDSIFFAIHYERPDILRYLHRRGVDFNKFCDPMNFGSPMFYATCLKKYEIVKVLVSLGLSIKDFCDSMGSDDPLNHAIRLDDKQMQDLIVQISSEDLNAAVFFHKNWLRYKERKNYAQIKKAISILQRAFRRGFFKIADYD